MRDMSVSWPRWMFYIGMAALLMWSATALDPGAKNLERITVGKTVRSTLDAIDPGVIKVGKLSADLDDRCRDAATALLAGRVTVAEGQPGELKVRCRSSAGEVTATSSLALPDKPATHESAETRIPTSFSILPPLAAVLLALLLRQILLALLLAIFWGAMLLTDLDILPALGRTVEVYVFETAVDPWNLYVFGFTLALMGMVHVTIASGGMQGVIRAVARLASSVRMTQVATALMGLAIFFDDYANSVVVGSAARPLTDARQISREKLAYIVDSTAAPIAGVAIISTWIGVEVGYFEGQIEYVRGVADSGYDLFFQVMPYRFYCLFAVAMVFIIAASGRDFGPMLKAERRARRTGQVAPKGPLVVRGKVLSETVMKRGAPPRWLNGVLPVLVVIFGTFAAFVVIGSGRLEAQGQVVSWFAPEDLMNAFKAVGEDNIIVLFWASVSGGVAAILLALGQRILSPVEAGIAWLRGVWAMLPAIALLVLAIGIRKVTEDLETATFLVALLGDLSAWMLPLATFLLAAGVAFATGTSWGTMGILIPVAIPLAAELVATQGADPVIILLVTGSVLDGAIFGDHCSVISDTTVMSSMASQCDHLAHVRTQVPYALLAMTAAALCGYLLQAMEPEMPVFVPYILGLGLMVLWVRLRGRHADKPVA